jgi:hypothetical protein
MITTKLPKHVRKAPTTGCKEKNMSRLNGILCLCGMNSEPAVNGTKVVAAVSHRKNCKSLDRENRKKCRKRG